jgi:hypothetical protein
MTTEQILAENDALKSQIAILDGGAIQKISALESENAQLTAKVAQLTAQLSEANEASAKKLDETQVSKRVASKIAELGISSVGIKHPGHSIVAGDMTAQELWAMPADQRREFIKNYKKQS